MGHQALLRGAGDVATIIARVVIMFNSDITQSTSAVPASVLTERITSKDFFFARSCLGKIPGGAPFSQRRERATACTIRMQIVKQIYKETN